MKKSTSVLIEEVWAKLNEEGKNVTKTAVEDVVKTFIDVVKNNVVEGNDVIIQGLVSFALKIKENVEMRNPATEETFIMKRAAMISSKVSDSFKNQVKNKWNEK
jgi:nucleoid DNA-binding protein